MRGPEIFAGYYGMEEKAKQAIDAESWLSTGDIAEVTESLAFRIIDRKDHMFKLQNGEFVVPDRV